MWFPLPMPSQTTVPSNPASAVPQVNTRGNNPPPAVKPNAGATNPAGLDLETEKIVNQMWNLIMTQSPEAKRPAVLRSLFDRLKRMGLLDDAIKPFLPTPAETKQNTPTEPQQNANANTVQADASQAQGQVKAVANADTTTKENKPNVSAYRKAQKAFTEIQSMAWSITDPNQRKQFMANQANMMLRSGEIDEETFNMVIEMINNSVAGQENKQSNKTLSGENLFWIMLLTTMMGNR